MGHWVVLHPYLEYAYRGCVERDERGSSYLANPPPIWRLEHGSVVLKFRSETERFVAPCWILPRAQEGRQFFSEDARILSIRVSLLWPDETPIWKFDSTIQFPVDKFPEFEGAAEALVSAADTDLNGLTRAASSPRLQVRGAALLTSQLWGFLEHWIDLMQRLGYSFEARTALDPRVLAALDRLVSLPFRESLTRDELALRCGLSLPHLVRLFQREIKLTPAQVRDRKKLRAARQALRFSDEPQKSVASELGFPSSQQFARWFKRHTHLLPSEYRSL